MEQINNKIHELEINEHFDMIVMIANWGIIPWMLLAQKLKIPYEILYINYRDETHKPIYKEPVITKLNALKFDYKDKDILLVDDVTRSGATFNKAKECLVWAKKIKTFTINWEADYSTYNEECFLLPWILKW